MGRLLTFEDFRREYLPQTHACPCCGKLVFPGEAEHRHPRNPLAEAVEAVIKEGGE